MRPAPLPSEGPLPALDQRNRRQRSRLATRTGSLLQQESTGKEPQAHHVVVRELEGYRAWGDQGACSASESPGTPTRGERDPAALALSFSIAVSSP